MFPFTWDTKASGVSEGEHTLKAVLYEPNGLNPTSVSEKGSSEVKVTVANKISNGPGSLLLRYRYREGEIIIEKERPEVVEIRKDRKGRMSLVR